MTDPSAVARLTAALADHYTIERELGAGGMATVYVAQDSKHDRQVAIKVRGHKVVWVTPLSGGAPYQVFEFPDPAIRIDYPVWSPDGRFMLFDHDAPHGGDIWLLDGVE